MKITQLTSHIGKWMILCAILFLAFWIRIQGVNNIPSGQFTETDAYLYYSQAQLVSEDGQLPERDMSRWVPIGRDLGQTLNLYPYMVAYAHKLTTVFFPNISLYDFMLFAPTVCFIIGLGVLCLFLYHTYGFTFAMSVGMLLATLPSVVERSAAGFSDRDSFCWLLGVLAFTMYLAKEQTQYRRTRFLFSAISGFFVFLGGLAWEGFGVFVLVVLCVELWRFIASEEENYPWEYLLWVLMFVPGLFLASPAYRTGQGFSTHLTVLVLVPPLVVLGLYSIRYLLQTRKPFSKWFHPHARLLAFLLTLLSLTIGGIYFFSQQNTFALSTVPFSNSRLMQTVTELNTPHYDYWMFRFGGVWLLGSIGLMVVSMRLWKQKGTVLVFPLSLFVLTTFFQEPLRRFLGTGLCNIFFFLSFISVIGFALGVALLRKGPMKNELCYVALAAWFLLWVGLSRDAKRYDFFIGVPVAFFAVEFMSFAAETVSKKIKLRIPQTLLKGGIAIAMLTALLFWLPGGGYAKRTVYAAKELRKVVPGHTAIEKGLHWMKTELSDTAVVAANWGYGSMLNVLGGVNTVVDQDHFIQHWIHLYCRHVFSAQSEQEALTFLKTHGATHLMLTENDLVRHARGYSFVGSDANLDRMFEMMELHAHYAMGSKYRLFASTNHPPFVDIDINFSTDIDGTLSVTARLKDGTSVDMPYVAFVGKRRVNPQNQVETNPNLLDTQTNLEPMSMGGTVLYFDEQARLYRAYYIPPIGWNNLSVRLFFRGLTSDAFVPVFPTEDVATAKAKVWEIRYPVDITARPEFLAIYSGD